MLPFARAAARPAHANIRSLVLRTGNRPFHMAKRVLQESKRETPSDGVSGPADPGTKVHDFDPKKPRKPLSRIAIGAKTDVARQQQEKTIGFLNWKAAAIFLVTGGGLYWYMQREKQRLSIQREAEANRGYGNPLVGGPFKLRDQNGNEFSEKDLLGKFALIYFGFSMCPDICPEELDKMTEIIDDINKDEKKLLPIFITCDPNRDSPEVLKEYLLEFHPDIIGLTGTYDEIKQVCKDYRVYFSTPPDLKPGDEYLVDHSIFFYLMDPEGNFIDALGRNYEADTGSARIKEHIAAWIPASEREVQKKSWLGGLFDSK